MKSESCARWIVGSLVPLFDHRDAQTVMVARLPPQKARPPAQALPHTAPGVSPTGECIVGRGSDRSMPREGWLRSS